MFLLKAWRASVFGVHGFFNYTQSGFRDHAKRFKPEEMTSSMQGKNCLVTGANSGIGYATAEGLAARGATVYMICRNRERGEAAVSEIRSKSNNHNVHLEVCDLSLVSDVKALASRFSTMAFPIHVLVNNAGILENKKVFTSEGLEMSFAVNVLGTFCMTELLMPMMKKAAPDARVITVSSGGMYSTTLNNDLQFTEGEFNGVEQYARNKRIQVALTEKWAETHKEEGISFYSMHPGWVKTPGVSKSLPGFNERLSNMLRTKEEGADTIIWLAMQPNKNLTSGALYFDRSEARKDLLFASTKSFHANIDPIFDKLRSMLMESI